MLKIIVNRFFKIFIIILISATSYFIIAQSKKEDLFERKKKVEEEIALTTKILESTTKRKGKTLQNIKLIDKKISQRKNLISIYQREIVEINEEIDIKEKRIYSLNAEILNQKKYYSDFIYYAYKNNTNYTIATYLLASNTLNQFYMRRKYLDQLKDARLEKIKLIQVLKEEINKEVASLISKKKDREKSIESLKSERTLLTKEKYTREIAVKELINEETELRKKIKEKKRIEAEISEMIEKIIREETAKDKFAKLTPEMQLLSDSFERNKGRLPWPTRQGIITESFGKHWHPVIPGVETFNSGVDISTTRGEDVRTIFAGTVSKIFRVKGANFTVIVRHGSFYTAYINIANVRVNVGDSVKTKDIIGSVAFNNSDGSSVLHLQIWKGFDKLNPEDWLSN